MGTTAACPKERLDGLGRQRVLGDGHVLGKGALAPTEDLVTRPELRHVLTDGLDLTGQVQPRNMVPGAAQPTDCPSDTA
jgi:hypothetical protein